VFINYEPFLINVFAYKYTLLDAPVMIIAIFNGETYKSQ